MLGLTVLGNNSAVPAFDRHPTSQVVTMDGDLFLVDCGEGTQIQMIRYRIRRSKISHIFISHLHGDHFAGLVWWLLHAQHVTRRTVPLSGMAADPFMARCVITPRRMRSSRVSIKRP